MPELSEALPGSGANAKLRGLLQIRRAFLANPSKLSRLYVLMARERTGISDAREHFGLDLYSKALRSQFGRHTGLYRIHYFLSVAADLALVQGKPASALGLIVQILKAVHQVALSNGAWDLATLMIPVADPLGPPRFAGDLNELAAVASYKEAVSALLPKTAGGPAPVAESGEVVEATRGQPKAKGRRPRGAPAAPVEKDER